MIDNKYFQPDIEDLRIGFEGEINWNRAYEDKFIPFKIRVTDEEGTYTNEISDIIDALDDGYAEARVAYLTKEQIEAEGWEFYDSWERCTYKMSDEEKYIKYKKVYKDKKNCFDKPLIVYLTYFFNTHFIFLNNDESYDDLDTYYQGQCPSINEFRYICKLLKI